MKQNKLISLFQKLSEDYKETPICRHLVSALGDYPNIEFVDNKVLIASLQSYVDLLELNASFQYQNEEDFEANEEF